MQTHGFRKNPALNLGRLPSFFLIAAAALIFIRLALVLIDPNHLGVDGGAYLVGRNHVLNIGETNSAFTRLPLGPGWLLVPFTALFGDNAGYKVWSALFSVVPALPAAYLLAGRYLSKGWAAGAAFIAVGGWLSTEMFVTGALPLIGFGFTMLAMWGVAGIADPRSKRRRKYGITIALALPLLALTNHTAAGISAIILPVWTIALYSRYRFRKSDLIFPVIAGIGLATFAWPWYPQVGMGSDTYRYPGPILFLRETVMDIGYYVAAAAFVTSFYAWKRKWHAMAITIAFLGFWAPFYSFDETIVNLTYRGRFLCSMLMPIVWVAELRDRLADKPIAMQKGVLGMVAAAIAIGSLMTFNAQRDYSTFVNPDVEKVLAAVELHPAKGSIITSNFGEGTWYQGLTGRSVYYTFAHEPPRAFTQSDQDVRCIFNWVAGCDVEAAIQRLDAAHVVINRHWPADWGQIYKAPADGRDRLALWLPLDQAAWLEPIAVSNEVKAWSIRR